MEIKDIIKELSNIIDPNLGEFFFVKAIKPHNKFKLYKTIEYRLYLYNTDLIFSADYQVAQSAVDLDIAIEATDRSFLKDMLIWITSDKFKELM